MLRRLAMRLYACYAWTVFVVLLLMFGVLIVFVQKRGPCRQLARLASRAMFRLCGVPQTVTGLSTLPSSSHVLVVNHTSFIDGLALSAMLPASPGYVFVVRRQYRSQTLLWPLLAPLGTVVLHEGHGGSETNIGRLRAALRRGDNLIIFPEGRIRPSPGVDPLHSGAFVAAGQEGAPVVVAGLQGTRAALGLHRWMPRRVPVALRIGLVLLPTESGFDLECALQTAHDAMAALAGEAQGVRRSGNGAGAE